MTGTRFEVEFYNQAACKDYLSLDGSKRKMVQKGIARLAMRADEIGKPLTGTLLGCKELKFRSDGIRVVFRIDEGVVSIVQIIAIAQRDKGEAFDVATKRLEQPSNGAPVIRENLE